MAVPAAVLRTPKATFSPGGNLLRRNFQKTFRSDLAIFKFVNRNAVAGIAWLRARGIGD